MACAIETFSLTKYFPKSGEPNEQFAAVDRITLGIKSGELFGLLGPNGAGKTTLIKMLATLIIPSSGAARINGNDLSAAQAVREAISLVGSDERSFYWRLTARQNLEFFASLYRLPPFQIRSRVMEVLRLMGLEDAAGKQVKAYSSGMKQRLAIARALLSMNPILLLDEPTRGLDPLATRELHQLIVEELVGRQGVTVILATHQLWEAEALCHRVAVMHRGRLQGCGSPSELRRDLGLDAHWRLTVCNLTPNLRDHLEQSPLGIRTTPGDDERSILEWKAEDGAGTDDVVRTVLREGGTILGLAREQASLETIFETLTKRRNPDPESENESREERLESRGSGRSLTIRVKEMIESLRSWPRLAWAFLKRDFIEECSYRLSFSIQLISIFFSVAMFYFMSLLFGENVSPYMAPYGTDYFSFALLGIAFSRYFDIGLSTFSNSLREAQTTGTLEAMLTSSTGISRIIVCSSLWNFLFASLQVLAYLVLGTVLFKARLVDFSLPAVFAITALTIVCFSSVGIFAAGFIMVYKRGDPVVWFFSTISTLLSGVYYPLSILPEWLKPVAYCLPTTYVMEAVRRSFLQGASIWDMRQELTILALFCLVLLPLSLVFFRLTVHRAKVDGSLTHY